MAAFCLQVCGKGMLSNKVPILEGKPPADHQEADWRQSHVQERPFSSRAPLLSLHKTKPSLMLRVSPHPAARLGWAQCRALHGCSWGTLCCSLNYWAGQNNVPVQLNQRFWDLKLSNLCWVQRVAGSPSLCQQTFSFSTDSKQGTKFRLTFQVPISLAIKRANNN